MNGLIDILRSYEKQGRTFNNQEENLLDRNINVIYKGDTQLAEESLSNILSIHSLDRIRDLYQANTHHNISKLKFFNQIIDWISNQEVLQQDHEEHIMFHSFALKVSRYMSDELQQNHLYQESKHNLLNEEAFLKNISYQFQQQVLRISYRTLVLDLNRNQEEGTLRGGTEEEQYAYYSRVLLETPAYIKDFFHLYPGLLRIIVNETRKYVKHLAEILTRYDSDKNAIARNILQQNQTEQIKFIEVGLGDAHSDGRKVTKLSLENQSLMYKPRNMNIDRLYSRLIEYVNEKIGDTFYRLDTPSVISRQDYGWVQFIPFKECEHNEDIEHFYSRMGGQVALLYALNAVDFHSENVIANGSSPVLIDLESLFHVPHSNVRVDQNNAHVKAFEQLTKSVRAIGLLPFFFGKNNADVSGIGQKGKVQSIIKVPQIKRPNSSSMKVERDFVEMESASNQPKLNGKFVQTRDYLGELKQGFEKVYETIMQHTAEFLTLIEAEKDDVLVRFIPKPTVQYSSFSELSLHPRFLHNAIDREVYLAKIWEDTKANDRFVPLVKHEYDDLLNNDIPYFKLFINAHDLLNSRNEKVKGYFEHSPLDLVRERIKRLSSEDMAFQLEVIDLSMLAAADDRQKELNRFTPKDPEDYIEPFKSESFLLDKAEELAEYVYSKSFIGKKNNRTNYSWLNTSTIGVDEIQWRLSPMGNTLYDGLSGMALTYLSLWIVTRKAYYLSIAIDIAEDIYASFKDLELPDDKEHTMSVGAFSGISSIIYLFMNLDAALDEPKYKDLALELTEKLPHFLSQDKEYDIVSGSAGAIAVLVNCYKQDPEPIFLEVAAICAGHLLENAVTVTDDEAAWIGVTDQPLTGFSHGSAGIIYALTLLNDFMRDERISDFIIRGRNYENRQMVQSNWADRRNNEQETSVSAWCHGSPGILISRLGMADSHDETIANSAIKDIEIAKHNMYYDGFGREHSLCHGDIGNAAILISYGRKMNQPDLETIGQNLMLESFQEAQKNGYRCGVGRGAETPNFMVGLAGMVYGALFACNKHVPDILSLNINKID